MPTLPLLLPLPLLLLAILQASVTFTHLGYLGMPPHLTLLLSSPVWLLWPGQQAAVLLQHNNRNQLRRLLL